MTTPNSSSINLNGLQFNRLNQVLALLLIVQLALAVVLFWPKGAAETDGGLLLGELTSDQVTGLVITDGTGNAITLSKSGGGWVLPDADDYPVDETKVTPVLEKLAELKSDRLVTRTDDSHKRLKVASDDFERKLEVSAGGKTETVYLGTAAGPSATHIRLDGQDETWLTGELSSWEVNSQPDGWIDTTYFGVPQTDVTAFTLSNANGDLSFEKDTEDNWTLVGLTDDETVNNAAITSLLNRVVSVRMAAPLGKSEASEYGLSNPEATVTLTVQPEDGSAETVTLRVGAELEDGNRAFHASGEEYIVSIAAYNATDLIEKARADFIAAPEETTETSQ